VAAPPQVELYPIAVQDESGAREMQRAIGIRPNSPARMGPDPPTHDDVAAVGSDAVLFGRPETGPRSARFRSTSVRCSRARMVNVGGCGARKQAGISLSPRDTGQITVRNSRITPRDVGALGVAPAGGRTPHSLAAIRAQNRATIRTGEIFIAPRIRVSPHLPLTARTTSEACSDPAPRFLGQGNTQFREPQRPNHK